MNNEDNKVCEICKEEKEDVELRINPYIEEVIGEVEYQYLCNDCYEELWDNI